MTANAGLWLLSDACFQWQKKNKSTMLLGLASVLGIVRHRLIKSQTLEDVKAAARNAHATSVGTVRKQ